MPRRPSIPDPPKTPNEFFGVELFNYRKLAGLGRVALGELLGYTEQWIGQIESGKYPPSEDFANDCDTFFETNGSFHRKWEWIKKVERLQIYLPGFAECLEREKEAVVIHAFELSAVSGILQTPEYAREQIEKDGSVLPEKVNEVVESRMARKEILTGEDPCHLVAVFDETVLRRQVGGPEVMRGQIEYLINAAERHNITIQIVPFSRGSYPGTMGSFEILGFEGEPDVVYAEGHLDGQLVQRADHVRGYSLRYDRIRALALPADETLKLLHEILESM
ncbi:helix-turn-helix domain-containing protein [Actinomadura atramentaria]|uniref:helix-turn-helix domain-containing protein n=1 Tax=Actinomadura atramentaria TaxID=1990 RepID=UPI00037FD8B7|nr:helix-turn-helix transcriptional regulator [Actinomadura atramentaria]